jgi:hypothetical protein
MRPPVRVPRRRLPSLHRALGLGCPGCPRQTDPRFETGELVAADQLLASNAILAERLALMVRPLVVHTRADLLSDLPPGDIRLLSDAYDLLRDLAKQDGGG